MLKLFLSFVLSLSTLVLQAQPILWGSSLSPYVRKVAIGLEIKEREYEQRQVLPSKIARLIGEEPDQELENVSFQGRIPAYQEEDFSVADSSVILAYLEKAYPDCAIYPTDPKLLARALWLEEYADVPLADTLHTKLFVELVIKPLLLGTKPDQEIVENGKKELIQHLNYLEKQLEDPAAGKYFIQDQLSIADIAIVTHFVSLNYADISVDVIQYPKLSTYLHEVLSHPVLEKILKKEQIILEPVFKLKRLWTASKPRG